MGPDLEKGQHHQQGGQYVQGQGQYPQQGGHYAQGQGYYDQNQTRTQQPGPTYPPVAHTYAT